MGMREWAERNGLGEVYAEYLAECEAIAEQCEEEGYPSHGSNYELRVSRLRESYPELFGDDEEEGEEDTGWGEERVALYAEVWAAVNDLYKSRPDGAKPSELINVVINRFGELLVVETFAAVAQLKKGDGRIYGKNREWTDSMTVVPEALKWDPRNPLIRVGVDEIHTANVNVLITELRAALA